MKWIGQHIWDFISRFRTTVYLENLETSSEENVLVVDSDGKVTKNTTLGGSDLTITNAGDNRVVTSTGGSGLNAESGVTYDGTTFAIGDLSYIDAIELLQISGSEAASQPALILQNSHTGAVGPALGFIKTADGDDDDQLGKISFTGDDDGGASQVYAQIEGYIGDASAGAEEGKLILSVASHDGEIQPGLTIASGNAEDEVDVTIGNGPLSVIDTEGAFRGGNIGVIQDAKIPVSPTQFMAETHRYPVSYNISNGGIQPALANVKHYAEIILPSGYTATSCTMYATDSDNDCTLQCYSGSIDSNSTTALAGSATSFSSGSATLDFGANDVDGNGSKTIVIEWHPGDTADRLHGGFISIQKTV